MIRAVIFDLDGTLVDTEPSALRGVQRSAASRRNRNCARRIHRAADRTQRSRLLLDRAARESQGCERRARRGTDRAQDCRVPGDDCGARRALSGRGEVRARLCATVSADDRDRHAARRGRSDSAPRRTARIVSRHYRGRGRRARQARARRFHRGARAYRISAAAARSGAGRRMPGGRRHAGRNRSGASRGHESARAMPHGAGERARGGGRRAQIDFRSGSRRRTPRA